VRIANRHNNNKKPNKTANSQHRQWKEESSD
jgi:hypothetical protein